MNETWIEGLDRAEWERVNPLLDAMLDLETEQVPSFLERVAERDPALRRRLESFVRADRAAGEFLPSTFHAWNFLDEATEPHAEEPRDRPAPARLGRFSVLRELGRGGMGVVYLGREESTGREFALKLLPATDAKDVTRMASVLREARLLACLHHPAIATIHAVERSESGERFLVLERIVGETLAERLGAGPLPVHEAIDLAHQLANALGAAHRLGIVHRDLKPTNLMRTPDGLLKVLDFGIAQHFAPAAARDDSRAEGGSVLGTPGYMSPERILGRKDTPACDLFSFGCVLYECLTGRAAFDGDDRIGRLSATLYMEVDLEVLPEDTPDAVRALLRSSLDKDPGRRGTPAEAAAILGAIAARPQGIAPRRLRSRGLEDRLPAPATPFIGRERELEECANALSRSRLVTLSGPGGCGKTRLAIETAQSLSRDEFEVIWFADLAPATSPPEILAALSSATDVRAAEGAGIADAIGRRLAGRRGLLVLDNCEHLTIESAKLTRELLDRCQRLSVLATSREWLGVSGELMLRVSPLPVPRPDIQPGFDSVAANESVRLFVEHARVANPAFQLTSANVGSVVTICRVLDGIPLALEIAAALLDRHPIEQLGEQIAASSPAPLRDLDQQRHSCLTSTIQFSYDRLDDVDRRCFEALSVFAGGWSLESALVVCGDSDLFEVLDRLTRLMDRSLVQVDPAEHAEPRYRFLEPIRSFAHAQIAGTPRAAEIGVRHALHFAELAEQLEPRGVGGPSQVAALKRFEGDHQNFLAALRNRRGLLESIPGDVGLRIAVALWRFWYMRGHFAVGRDELLSVLESSREQPATLRGRALAAAGVLTMYLDQDARAKRFFREALKLHRAAGDRSNEASTLNHLGVAAFQRGQNGRARVLLQAARLRFEELGDSRWLALISNNLGAVARQKGDLVEASEHFDRAIPLARTVNNLDDLGLLLVNAALVNLRLGRVGAARGRIHEAIEVIREAGARRVATAALEVAGEVLLELDLAEDAARVMGSAQRVRAVIGVPADEGWRRGQQPFLDRLQNRFDPARYEELVREGTLVSYEEVLDHVVDLVQTRH